MTDIPRLLGISGSLRAGSRNTALVHEAARAFGRCDFTLGSLRAPLYDGDLEDAEGIPEAVTTLDAQIEAAGAVVISCPEYNKGLPGGLKNALDWLSRTGTNALRDKPLAIVSAAGGRSGGEVTQFSLRNCLVSFRPRIVTGPAVMIAGAGKAFDAEGRLINPKSFEALAALMAALREEMAR